MLAILIPIESSKPLHYESLSNVWTVLNYAARPEILAMALTGSRSVGSIFILAAGIFPLATGAIVTWLHIQTQEKR
jgi:hypothetical protein